MIYYLIVLIGVFACSASQVLLKKSASEDHHNVICMMLNWKVMLSYAIMFITLVTNIFAMKNGVQLKDMPILEATGYIFVPILSMLFLSEKITKKNIVAIGLIVIGIITFYA